MKAQTVAIIGLNRIGGSVGLALRQSKLALEIVGHDANGDLLKQARDMGAIDKGDWSLTGAAAAADILVLTALAPDLEATLQAIGPVVRPHALVLDLGYLKRPAQQWAQTHLRQGHYVGAAPVLAANALTDARTGLKSARADLFQNSLFCFMPSAGADRKAVETAVNLGVVLGARPFFIDAEEYDSLMYGLETLPGLLGTALFQAVSQAPGWRDMLRFAGPSFAFATAGLAEPDLAYRAFHDQAATLRWLDGLLEEMKKMRRLIAQSDRDGLAVLLQQSDIERDTWLRKRAENEWQENETPQISSRSLAETLLGGLARRDEKDE